MDLSLALSMRLVCITFANKRSRPVRQINQRSNGNTFSAFLITSILRPPVVYLGGMLIIHNFNGNISMIRVIVISCFHVVANHQSTQHPSADGVSMITCIAASLRHLRPMMSTNTATMVACAIVSSGLDYCNSVLAGMSDANFTKLERVQYSLARLVTGMPVNSRDHMIPVLPSCIGYQSAPGSLSRSPRRSSRFDRRGSHPTLRNSSKMLFYQGHYGLQQVASVL